MSIKCLFGKHQFRRRFHDAGKLGKFYDEDVGMINCINCGYTFQIEEKNGKKKYTKLKWLGT